MPSSTYVASPCKVASSKADTRGPETIYIYRSPGVLPPPRTPPQRGQIIAAPRGPGAALRAAPGPGRRFAPPPGCSIILAYLRWGPGGRRQPPRGPVYVYGFWAPIIFVLRSWGTYEAGVPLYINLHFLWTDLPSCKYISIA